MRHGPAEVPVTVSKAEALARARRRIPLGSAVTYWPGGNLGSGTGFESTTRSEVWRLPAGQLVVAVEGYAGGIAITHIIVRKG